MKSEKRHCHSESATEREQWEKNIQNSDRSWVDGDESYKKKKKKKKKRSKKEKIERIACVIY